MCSLCKDVSENRKNWSGEYNEGVAGMGKSRTEQKKECLSEPSKKQVYGKKVPLSAGKRQQPKQTVKKKSMDRER